MMVRHSASTNPQAPGTAVHDLFADRARKSPLQVAAVENGTEWTYEELAQRAHRIAHLMIGAGAGPGDLVALLMDRSVDFLAAALGVLGSGAGYVSLAADDPAPRVAHLLRDCSASVVVTSASLDSCLAEAPSSVEVYRLGDPDVEALLAEQDATAPHDAERRRELRVDDTAYVIYTSGSTGEPKGVVVQHQALSTYLAQACARYPAVAGRTLLHSSVCFDMSVTSLFAPLISGGTIEVFDLVGALVSGAPLPKARPTFLKVTPSHLATLNALPDACSPTALLVVGGEALSGVAVDAWRCRHPQVTVVNEYGPTEATVGCIVHEIGPGEAVGSGPVPIGHPFPGTDALVVDEECQPVVGDTPGELLIGGAQLARGYLGQPALTADRFITEPATGRRLYRTGDLVRVLPDGTLEFLGRQDAQLKVNGYRVEPGEIEATLCRVRGVQQAVVRPAGSRHGGTTLIAYVRTTEEGPDVATLRVHAAELLPQHLVPSTFVPMLAFPLTASGKLDTTRLEEAKLDSDVTAPNGASDVHVELCQLVQDILETSVTVGPDDDFLALGGNSIAAARLVTRARANGIELSLIGVLRGRTVRNFTKDQK